MRSWIRRTSWNMTALGLLALFPVQAADANATAKSRQPAASASLFQVDPTSSRVYTKVGSSGRIGHEHGVTGRLTSGTVNLGGGGELVFNTRSFLADLPEARKYVGLTGTVSKSDQQKTNENMLGPHILDVSRFPTATYTFTSAAPLEGQAPGDPGRYRLEGRFTLHGVTQPLPLNAVVERIATPGVLRMRCAFAILQSDFGITPYSALGGLVSVADRLEIWGDLLIQPPSR